MLRSPCERLGGGGFGSPPGDGELTNNDAAPHSLTEHPREQVGSHQEHHELTPLLPMASVQYAGRDKPNMPRAELLDPKPIRDRDTLRQFATKRTGRNDDLSILVVMFGLIDSSYGADDVKEVDVR